MTWLTVLTERKPALINSEYARLVKGAYGKHFVLDEDGDEVVVPYETDKKGRGRPKKTDGINFSYSPELMYCEMLWSGIDIDFLINRHTKGKKKCN